MNNLIIVLGTAVILYGFLFLARRGYGGKIGRMVRNSDHWALEDAIREKGLELTDLIENFTPTLSVSRKELTRRLAEIKMEHDELISLRSKYPAEKI